MVTIVYDSYFGTPVPDGQIELALDRIRAFTWPDASDSHFVFSTENIFNAIRLAIVQGRISYDAVQFKFAGQLYTLEPDGMIANWPKGFLSIAAETSKAILFGGIEMRRRKTQGDSHAS